jgi:hypothetical protein
LVRALLRVDREVPVLHPSPEVTSPTAFSSAEDLRSSPLPLAAHLGHLDRVLTQERVRRLLLALQRRRELAEDRAFLEELG